MKNAENAKKESVKKDSIKLMTTPFKLPFYVKASLIITGLLALFYIMFIGQAIILPIIYSIIIAIVLSPAVDWLTRRKFHRGIAIALVLVFVIAISLLLVALVSKQFMSFTDSFPLLIDKFGELMDTSSAWISDYFNISPKKINAWILAKKAEIISQSGAKIGTTLVNTGSALVVLVLIPVYVFMILFYQPLLLEFVHRVFKVSQQDKVTEVLTSIKIIIRSYLIGLLLEAAIVATLNITGLLIIGIEYAVLLGIIGALLNFIPYLGNIIAGALAIIVTLATTSSFTSCLLVVASYSVVQLIDNNFILPKLVASKVKINALVSVIVVLAGGALWGVAGMFLSIPLIAIIKVLFDHIEPLQPWGYLLGDTLPANANQKTSSKFISTQNGDKSEPETK